jgi:hypothetical protein
MEMKAAWFVGCPNGEPTAKPGDTVKEADGSTARLVGWTREGEKFAFYYVKEVGRVQT